jgi:hypothetical protein
MKKSNAKKKSIYEKDAVIVEATVCKIELQNEIINDKYKTVFYCPSYEKPEGRMCIVWGRTTFQVGDKVKMTGRFNDGVFLVWSLLYKSDRGDRA